MERGYNMKNFMELHRNTDVRLRKIDNIYYILSKNANYEVNETGAIILNHIGKDMTIDEFCTRLAKKCNFNDLDVIKKDVNSYIDFMLNEKIIEEKEV